MTQAPGVTARVIFVTVGVGVLLCRKTGPDTHSVCCTQGAPHNQLQVSVVPKKCSPWQAVEVATWSPGVPQQIQRLVNLTQNLGQHTHSKFAADSL